MHNIDSIAKTTTAWIETEMARLRAKLTDACATRDALARECNELEEACEYNASLVMRRDRELTRMRKAAQKQGAELKDLQGANRALGQQLTDEIDNCKFWHEAALDIEVERDRWRKRCKYCTKALDAAEATLANCGLTGIYSDFDGPANAIKQMVERLVQVEGKLQEAKQHIEEIEGEPIKVEITGAEMVQALQAERRLRQMVERRAAQYAESLGEERDAVHKALDECQVPRNYDDGDRTAARTRIFWLNQRAETAEAANDHLRSVASQVPYLKDRAERAEALAQLVTPELAALLERIGTAYYPVRADKMTTCALAAQIRKALDDSQA